MERERDALDSELREAEATLKASLDEACSTNPARADTGELIKIEEVLAIATDAAKRAISIRRRRKAKRDTAKPPLEPAVEPPQGHRSFSDPDGVEWAVWSVHPMERPEKPRLRGTFQQGWLAFESRVGKRRLSPIPEGWQQMDEAALRALLARAEPAPRRADERRDREP